MIPKTYGWRWTAAVPFIVAGLALFSTLVMLLWNALMPVLFHLPVISYWQAVGLLILARFLFGGAGSHLSHWHRNDRRTALRNKIAGMSPEERRDFYRNMHHHHTTWHGDGSGEQKSEKSSGKEASGE